MANIQIPEALFYDILRYYIISSKGEDVPEELDKRVFDGLSDKVQKITDRELYTTYKTAIIFQKTAEVVFVAFAVFRFW